jgi:hypothetical protein
MSCLACFAVVLGLIAPLFLPASKSASDKRAS